MAKERLKATDHWALGGVTSESGQLERPVDATLLLVPGVIELEGDVLVWQHERVVEEQVAVGSNKQAKERLVKRFLGQNNGTYVLHGRRGKNLWVLSRQYPAPVVMPGAGLLEEFVRLANAPANAVRDYARRWGILGICEHNLPGTHNCTPSGPGCKPLGYCYNDDLETYTGREPISAWRKYSRETHAILDIAASLHQGRSVLDENVWRTAGIEPFPKPLPGSEKELCKQQAFALSIPVNGWLELGCVRPLLSWGGREPATVTLGGRVWWFHRDMQARLLSIAPRMQGTTLFGALAVQLMMAVSRTGGLALCSACGSPFVPKRRPNPRRRRYCPVCGRRAALRDAQAAHRAKQAK